MVCPLSPSLPLLASYEYCENWYSQTKTVNELSTTIDLESTLVRAEALFRRFQRTVEAIDKKSNFPAPKLRQRTSTTPAPASPSPATANTSSVDTVSAGGTNSGSPAQSSTQAQGPDKGKERQSGELEDQRPKVISPELRELLSRKVEVLPRKVVRREGEGLSSLKK